MLQRPTAKPEVKLPPPPDTEGGGVGTSACYADGVCPRGFDSRFPPASANFRGGGGGGRLKRRPAKPMGSARVGSIPAPPSPRPIFEVGVGVGAGVETSAC